MKKAVKKAAPKAVEPVHPLIELEALLASAPVALDVWLLVPIPEPKFEGEKNRQIWLDAVKSARVQLIHHKFGNLYDHARELSDAGGVLRVEITHVKTWVKVATRKMFIDGKMVDKE